MTCSWWTFRGGEAGVRGASERGVGRLLLKIPGGGSSRRENGEGGARGREGVCEGPGGSLRHQVLKTDYS